MLNETEQYPQEKDRMLKNDVLIEIEKGRDIKKLHVYLSI